MDTTPESPTTEDIQTTLVTELHRRQTRYDNGPAMNQHQQQDVHGELIGLRVALGIALGYPPSPGADGIHAANDYYTEWLGRQGDRPQSSRPT